MEHGIICFHILSPRLQDLKARLKEEMSRVQSAITDQRSEANKDRTCCELEVPSRIHEHTCYETESRKEVNASQRRCMFLQKSKQICCLTDKGWLLPQQCVFAFVKRKIKHILTVECCL